MHEGRDLHGAGDGPFVPPGTAFAPGSGPRDGRRVEDVPHDDPARLPAGIVVGIGDQGPETYRAAVRLGAEEASLRQVPLRLVHGSSPDGPARPASPSALEYRQQRGRRLVDGAARQLARTALGRDLRISTESSPRSGVELLLAYGRTAVMLVLQRGDGRHVAPGTTTSAVTAGAGCPTFVTRSGEPLAGHVGVLLVLDPVHDPAPAIALALAEASIRGIALTVLDGRGDRPGAAGAHQGVDVRAYDVAVRWAALGPDVPADRLRDVSTGAALMVVVRPAPDEAYGLVGGALDDARCPVLMVAPVDAGG
jgi:hypothetical protein